MIHLCMYDYSGTSGDPKSAPVKTNIHHDNVRNGVLFLRFIMVSYFFQSCITTRFTALVALMNQVFLCSVLIYIVVVGGEYSLLFAPSGEVLIANGKENVCGRLF